MVKTKIEGGMTIGLHVRRGDRHPWEYQYSGDYIPLINYMDEARQVLSDRYEHDEDEEEGEGHSHTNPAAAASPFSNIVATAKNRILAAPSKKKAKTKSFSKRKLEIELSERHGPAGMMLSKVLLASDDPDVHDSPEVSRTLRAQDRIMLASKRALENAQPGTKKNDWIDEIHGWEGGFYRDVFWGLGQSGLGASSPGSKVSEGAMQLRRMIGRAYVLDLAVLGEADTVVCGVSAMGCRLLAVMMGWERGIVRGGWRNVDGAFEWKGLVW